MFSSGFYGDFASRVNTPSKPSVHSRATVARHVREAGFDGGRSALVNAVFALHLPKNSEQAARTLQAPRRARAAAVIRAA